MDPDKALENARKALTAFLAAREAGRNNMALDVAVELVNAFESLDGWMSKGGFPPRAWAQRAL